MKFTRSHLPILPLVRKAGVEIWAPLRCLADQKSAVYLQGMTTEEEQWMAKREIQLASITNKKASRRGGEKWCYIGDSASSVDTPNGTRHYRDGEREGFDLERVATEFPGPGGNITQLDTWLKELDVDDASQTSTASNSCSTCYSL
jgi:hypothetical protein